MRGTASFGIPKVEGRATVARMRKARGVWRKVEAELVAGRERILGKRDLSGARAREL